jgi:CheY-like chemotaxis protein
MLSPELPPPPVAVESVAMTRLLHVLVVDDNADTADSMAMLIKLVGHEVRTANDGVAALQAALALVPDVVLLDIGLPRMDGYEVAAQMRQQVALRSTVLVATTGYGQEADRQRSAEAGFDHHLVKPVDFDKLQQILAGVAANANYLAGGGAAPINP